MYSYIRGILADVGEDYIVVEAAGVGYHIDTTAQTFRSLPRVGEEIKIFTHLYIREDAMLLYGFRSKDELNIFKLLIGVSGIGPKGALAILSVMTTDDLRFAVLAEDAKAIAKAPGVGAKTAQRLILELKDKLKLSDIMEEKTEELSVPGHTENAVKNDALAALVALGYSSSEALKAISGIEITEDLDVETLLKAALKNLAMF